MVEATELEKNNSSLNKMLTAWVKLIRPNIGILSSFGVLVGATISSNLLLPPIVYALLAAFLISSAGNVINDYFDLTADAVNQPRRPLPAGIISTNSALIAWIFFNCVGLLLAFYTSTQFFLIAGVNVIIAFFYSWQWQNLAVIGNLADSFLAAVTFLAGGLIANSFSELGFPLITLASIAFLGNLSREILKDVEDVEGDREKEAKTLPLIVGRKQCTYLARVILILALALVPLPYLLGFFGPVYLLLVLPAALLSLYPLFISYKQPYKGQKFLKKGMFGFMLAFLLAAVV